MTKRGEMQFRDGSKHACLNSESTVELQHKEINMHPKEGFQHALWQQSYSWSKTQLETAGNWSTFPSHRNCLADYQRLSRMEWPEGKVEPCWTLWQIWKDHGTWHKLCALSSRGCTNRCTWIDAQILYSDSLWHLHFVATIHAQPATEIFRWELQKVTKVSVDPADDRYPKGIVI